MSESLEYRRPGDHGDTGNTDAGEDRTSFSARQMAVIRRFVASTPDGRIHDFKAANLPYATYDGSMSQAEWDNLVAKLALR